MMKPKTKKLQLFNGWDRARGGHLYVAAATEQEAVELVNTSCSKHKGCRVTLDYFKAYWPRGWGTAMDGITPRTGVWRQAVTGGEIKRLQ